MHKNNARRFTMTPDHVTLLRRAYVDWEDCEYGAPAINCKRPYGNSSVAADIAMILGWPVDAEDGPTDEQRERAREIHEGTMYALQIVLLTGEMVPGEYVRDEDYRTRGWRRVS